MKDRNTRLQQAPNLRKLEKATAQRKKHHEQSSSFQKTTIPNEGISQTGDLREDVLTIHKARMEQSQLAVQFRTLHFYM